MAFCVFPGALSVVCRDFFEFSGVNISVCPFEGDFMGYREMLVSQRIQSGIGTPTIAENLGTSVSFVLFSTGYITSVLELLSTIPDIQTFAYYGRPR